MLRSVAAVGARLDRVAQVGSELRVQLGDLTDRRFDAVGHGGAGAFGGTIDSLDPTADSVGRIHGVRANASTMSHAELDAATDLDRGDVDLLADNYAKLSTMLDLRVIGGCCGTDHEHVQSVYNRLITNRAE